MTRKPRGHCHPLKHLCFINWLFGSLSSFTKAYDHLSSIHSEPYEPEASCSQSYSQDLNHGGATLENRRPSLRPKKVKPHIRSEIIQLLRAGVLKHLICAQFDIAIGTLNRILRSEPGLLDLWTGKRHVENLASHRADWMRTVTENSTASTNDIRRIIPNHYAWLYRNDRSWLNNQTQQLPTGYRGNHCNVDWERRDRVLYGLVCSTLARNVYPNGPDISLQSLYRLVPSLARSLEKRERYPMTRVLLKQIKSGSYRPGGVHRDIRP